MESSQCPYNLPVNANEPINPGELGRKHISAAARRALDVLDHAAWRSASAVPGLDLVLVEDAVAAARGMDRRGGGPTP